MVPAAAAPVGGPPTTSKNKPKPKPKPKRAQRSTGEGESEMDIDAGDGDRGRAADKVMTLEGRTEGAGGATMLLYYDDLFPQTC